MTTFKTFEDIDAWQRARKLTRLVYGITGRPPFSQDYGLKDQIRRCAVSVMANIAEGCDRGGNKEFYQFLSVSKSSLAELRSHLCVALDQNYIDEEAFSHMDREGKEIGSMLAGLMRHISKSQYAGIKYSGTEV